MSPNDPVFRVTLVNAANEDAPVRRLDEEYRITSFAFEDVEDKADKLDLQVENRDLRHFDDAVWTAGKLLEVTWGYPGRMAPPRRCTIQKVSGFTTLKVEALGGEAVMNKVQRIRRFEGVRRSDVARQIADEYDFDPPTQFIEDTELVLPQVTQARMSDHQLLRDMARREGFVFFVDFDGFHFHRRKLGQKPLRKFVWFTDPGVGDVISIGLDADVFAKKAGGIVASGRDPLTKTDIRVEGSNDATKGGETLADILTLFDPKSGAVLGDQVKKAVGSEAQQQTTEANAAAAKRAVDGAFANNQLTAVELKLEARGDPLLVAKSVVQLEGIGRRLSGNYYVKSVGHKIAGGYKMTLALRRTGTGAGAGGAAGVASKGAVNDKAADPGTEGGAGAGDLQPVTVLDPTSGAVVGTRFVDTSGRENGGSK